MTRLLVIFGLLVALCPELSYAQTAGEVNLTAASANVKESGSPVKIRVLRWSTDAEREAFVAALTPPPPAPAGAAGEGRGAGRGGAGRAGAGAAGGRGGAARGGGRGDAPVAPADPVATLTKAIGSAPLVGYIWTNDVTGYSIKYAYRTALPDGGERIILATDRRLGAHTTAWGPVAATTSSGAEALANPADTDYEFTLIEMRLDSKGLGEGKASLTTRVIVDDIDNGARTVALDNYAATPAILRNVKR